MDVPSNAKMLTLPNNDKVRVLAISVALENRLLHRHNLSQIR